MGPLSARALVLALAAVLAVGLVALAVVMGVGLHHVAGARTAAQEVMAQGEAADSEAAAAALRDLQRHSAGVGQWLGSAPWTWLGWLPVVGETITASAQLAEGMDAVVTPLAGGVAQVLETSGGDPRQAVAALSQSAEVFLEAGREAVAREEAIAAIDPDGVWPPLLGPIEEGQQRFAEAGELATGAAAGAVLLPGLLGMDAPTQWLLVAGQPAEARGSGAGYFGAVAVMQASDGDLQLGTVYPNDEFFNDPADLSLVPADFAQLWGETAAYVWGQNLTRHFPYAAALLHDSAGAVVPAARYVLALDPSVVASLLEITGPVTAAGVTIDSEGAESYFVRDIYRDYPDPEEKDRATSLLLAAVFESLQDARFSVPEIAAVLAESVADQRLLAWSSDPEEQEVLAWTPLAGGLPDDDLVLTSAINNIAGNKLDAYLESDVVFELMGDCTTYTAGALDISLRLDEIPPGLPDYVAGSARGPDVYGGSRVMVHAYGPPGADLVAMTIDDRRAVPQQGSELGRPVWGVAVDLTPGQSRTVSVEFAGEWQRGTPGYLAQPMVRPTSVEVVDLPTCLPSL